MSSVRVRSSLVVLALALGACDSQITQEEFEQSVPPLEMEAAVVGPASPVRDTLRVRVAGLAPADTVALRGVWLDGERVHPRWSRLSPLEFEIALYVSEMEGTSSVRVEIWDAVTKVVGADTLVVVREASETVRATIERTYWQRLVTGTSPYESSVTDVFADLRGDLWVRLSDYPSSFWSAAGDGAFARRRSGFERFLASEGDTAWIEYTTAGSGGSVYLARVDLATGETAEAYQVFYNDHLHAGASRGGEFFGIHSGGGHLMQVRGGIVAAIEDGPYALQAANGSLLGYHISADGVHWLATAGQGVLRNAGGGWEATPGLASSDALAVRPGPGGSVWSLAVAGAGCTVAEWDGAAWAERAAFDRDGNQQCGTVAIGATGGVWRGTSDGWITRSKGGAVDRRYASDGATSVLVQGSTVWVGTGYGLRKVRDYEPAGG